MMCKAQRRTRSSRQVPDKCQARIQRPNGRFGQGHERSEKGRSGSFSRHYTQTKPVIKGEDKTGWVCRHPQRENRMKAREGAAIGGGKAGSLRHYTGKTDDRATEKRAARANHCTTSKRRPGCGEQRVWDMRVCRRSAAHLRVKQKTKKKSLRAVFFFFSLPSLALSSPSLVSFPWRFRLSSSSPCAAPPRLPCPFPSAWQVRLHVCCWRSPPGPRGAHRRGRRAAACRGPAPLCES